MTHSIDVLYDRPTLNVRLSCNDRSSLDLILGLTNNASLRTAVLKLWVATHWWVAKGILVGREKLWDCTLIEVESETKTFFFFREHLDLPEENAVSGVETEVKTFFFREHHEFWRKK